MTDEERLKQVQENDEYVAEQLLNVTDKHYKKISSSIIQLITTYENKENIIPNQQPSILDLKRLNDISKDIKENVSKKNSKKIDEYLAVANISLYFYIQALIGIQSIYMFSEYYNKQSYFYDKDENEEVNFNTQKLNFNQQQKINLYSKIDTYKSNNDNEKRVWNNHAFFVAMVSGVVLQILKNRERITALQKFFPDYSFRKSINGGKYQPIKKVGINSPANYYFQNEQYSQEFTYRDLSADLIDEIGLQAFQMAGIKKVTIINEFNPCDICKGFVEVIYQIDEVPELPFHNNCRCRYATVDDL